MYLENIEQLPIILSGYIKYRAILRGFDFTQIKKIIRYSEERYFDTITQRKIVVGRDNDRLVMISYEKRENEIFQG